MSLQQDSSTAHETPLAAARRRRSGPPRGVWPTLRQSSAAFVSRAVVLDIVERGAVLLLFVLFVNRMLSRFVQLVVLQIAHPELLTAAAAINGQALLLVVSEALAVVLILMRRRTPMMSSHPFDWALCFLAASLPLLAQPAPAGNLVPAELATALMLAGLLLQIAAKAALWRSFGLVPANRGIRTGGPYRLLRHPMYAGYMLTHIGFLLGFPAWHNAALYVATFAIQVARLLREEAILVQDPDYRAYAAHVRARLLPGIF